MLSVVSFIFMVLRAIFGTRKKLRLCPRSVYTDSRILYSILYTKRELPVITAGLDTPIN